MTNRFELSRSLVDVEFEIGDVEKSRVSFHAQHFRFESRQMQAEFEEIEERHLRSDRLAEAPIIRGVGESGFGPVLQRRSRDDRLLNVVENFEEMAMLNRDAVRLQSRDSLVIKLDGRVLVQSAVRASTPVNVAERNTIGIVLDQAHVRRSGDDARHVELEQSTRCFLKEELWETAISY